MGTYGRRWTTGSRRCVLLSLPGELRNQIYQMLVPKTVNQYLDRPTSKEDKVALVPLLLVCRQVYREVLSTLHGYSQLNVNVAEQTAPLSDAEELKIRKEVGTRVNKAIQTMKHFDDVKIAVCLRPIAHHTTYRVLGSLQTLLAAMQKAQTDGILAPRVAEIRTCLHLWRGNANLGGAPYRTDMDELLNALGAYQRKLIIRCLVPEPIEHSALMTYQARVHNHNVDIEIAYLTQKCSAAGVQLVKSVVDAPACILAPPACFTSQTTKTEIEHVI